MGNYTSKFFSHCEESEKVRIKTDMTMSTIENNTMCTPVMVKREISGDPRSVTVGITRTPIQIAGASPQSSRNIASAIPKYLQMKKYLETDVDLILPAVTPVKRILDPRSPNVLQQRTPIFIKTKTEYLTPVVVVNEAPDMITPEDSDPRSPAMNFDRTPILKPKLTEQESSSCYSRIEKSGMKISYCETTGKDDILEIQTLPEIFTTTVTPTNLEERIKTCDTEDVENYENKEVEENTCSENSESETEDQITIIHNPKAINNSEEAQIDEVHENELKVEENPLNSETIPKTHDNEENKGKIVVWRDSVTSLTNSTYQNVDNPRVPKDSQEITIVYDDIVPKVSEVNSPKSHVKSENKPKLSLINKSIKNKQTIKKEGKGIIDDANIDVGRSRAPLATRYNKNEIDISRKSPQPVLRNKNLSTQRGQQENTPPNSKRYRSKTRANGTHWDGDMTVII